MYLYDIKRSVQVLTAVHLFVTHVGENRASKAFIRVCVFVCLSVRTIEPKRRKLQSPILPQG